MENLPEVVIFDLDGTLIENSLVVIEAYCTALYKYGYPEKSKEYIASLAGLSTNETAKFLGVDEVDWEKIDHYFWKYFEDYADDPNKMPILFEGVEKLLNFLEKKNIKMAVVTSNRAVIARKLLVKVNLIQYFDIIVGSEDVKNKKPSAEPIEMALKGIGQNIENVWMIGDTSSDVGAARNANILSIAIPQPHTFQSVISSKPDILIDSIFDLFHHLSSNFD